MNTFTEHAFTEHAFTEHAFTEHAFTEDNQFDVIAKYFNENGFVKHQLDSYEYFVNHIIQKIFDETPSIKIDDENKKYKASFGQVFVENAGSLDTVENKVKRIFPNECRNRDLTYQSSVFVDIIEEFYHYDKDTEKYEKTHEKLNSHVFLFTVPVMVGSSKCNLFNLSKEERILQLECHNCPSGYFIINGKERAIVSQERLNYNQPYVFETSNSSKYDFACELRSVSEETSHSVLVQAKYNEKGVFFSLPFTTKDIPAGIVFRAFGMDSVQIVKFINLPFQEDNSDISGNKVDNLRLTDLIDNIIFSSINIKKEKAIEFIASYSQKIEDKIEKKIDFTKEYILNDMFPHMGISTPFEKCVLLGSMIRKLFLVVLNVRKEDNRDNLSLKRIEGVSILFGDLLRMNLKKFIDKLKKYLVKKDDKDIISSISRSTNDITLGFRNVCLTGNLIKNTYKRTGVCQIINKMSYPAMLSHLRRVIVPIGKESKNVKIRQIDPSQIFFVDIIES